MTEPTAAAVSAARAADPPARPPALRPRRWLGVVFWAAMVGLLGWLWPRSHQTADLVAAFTRAGNIQGVLSHRGQLLVRRTSRPPRCSRCLGAAPPSPAAARGVEPAGAADRCAAGASV